MAKTIINRALGQLMTNIPELICVDIEQKTIGATTQGN